MTRLLYRITAGWLALFGALHTYGFLNFRPPTQEGLAVFSSMNSVHFTVKGNTYSYGNFYEGFGLMLSVYLFFSAFVSWQLADMKARSIAWALCAVQVAGVALSLHYFGPPQAISGLIAVGLTAWAAAKT
jgi:hypothetical protein